MPELNVERLKAIRDLIKLDPTKHVQRYWAEFDTSELPKTEHGEPIEVSCGTAACVAGWACQMEGDKFSISRFELMGAPSKVTADFVRSEDGEVHFIADRAREILGLDRETSNIVFCEAWSTKQVLKILKALIKTGEIPQKYVNKYEDF
ncbi:Uncharacterised protein [Mycobacteroides abscessus subsp. abscessus]|uniref:Uncharacterized protein n=1 Tax=Mycobacteroides abscessus subsp. abscessus TaxID=1185650 RepID=A0AB38D0X1_9MYCO|nr:hypothetical protein [Mycobacteroides abscessus]SHQ57692.1 Uncharacterised protein [Mycobacteroides abscessus subsp. abscessus]SHY19134.1 Uncharacterised protein [Mycobacteroides abscessus subsp. abscessus]SIA07944.1 Uncharacterised protein [Mycobacteroides abscessus subsp. abscessus]SIA16682.1 Uncharacterised protein [Mycobacteroides abscessus subsp. abscessus]SIB10597.1 Uncharacterised protein [Mycobacteroides abscessus subsp. abscessus]